ncbi:hypothetical protein BDA99DRAFT_605682 [Phascolomyces articulosus]|uniref:Uncharacterized protein n=1 Tax=Phascolomyces articulosus TaxID=60185 RepID=A0AAD5JYS3_9FUNG|nr:hypothetical protein BDA99DRAFT_605682 [Phascolomyces articulosus]
MTSLYSTKPSTVVPSTTSTHHHRTIRSSLTREDLLAMARNEYARQLCKFTEAQLKQCVPSCYTNSAYKQRMTTASSSSTPSSSNNDNKNKNNNNSNNNNNNNNNNSSKTTSS